MRSELRTIGLWVSAAGVVVTILVAVVQSREDDSAQGHVSDCRGEHDAPKRPQDSQFSQGLWADCRWPPPAGAEADGFGQVELSRVDNESRSNAGYVGADILVTECARVRLQYRLDQQGTQTISEAEVVDVGQVMRLDLGKDTKLRLEAATMPTFVSLDPNEVAAGAVVVVVPIAVEVQRLECA